MSISSILIAANDASGAILKGATDTCTGTCNTGVSVGGLFATVANVLIFLVGAISVIMIILGGFKYVTSGGDSKAVASAKDTILYAAIGVVVAICSYAIVDFVVVHVK